MRRCDETVSLLKTSTGGTNAQLIYREGPSNRTRRQGGQKIQKKVSKPYLEKPERYRVSHAKGAFLRRKLERSSLL